MNESHLLLSYIFILIYVSYLVVEGYLIIKKNAFEMDSEPLTKQYLFLAAIRIPCLSFCYFGILAWNGHKPQMDAQGFSNFIEISKLPLGLLSLTIPFAAVINNIHRTIQTNKQIKEAEKKNKIDGFYSHRKNTIEIFQNIPFKDLILGKGVNYSLSFNNCYKIYNLTFPFASVDSGNFTPSKELLNNSEKHWRELATVISITKEKEILNETESIHKIEIILNEIHAEFNLNELKNLSYFYTFYTDDLYKYELATKFMDETQIKLAILTYWIAYVEINTIIGTDTDFNLIEDIVEVLDYAENNCYYFKNFKPELLENYKLNAPIYSKITKKS